MLKDAGTEEAYEENLELYEQLTGSLIMQNPDIAETLTKCCIFTTVCERYRHLQKRRESK